MSQAFVREGDQQDLGDIAPTMSALVALLTFENGGIKVYEKRQSKSTDGQVLHWMSNGLAYFVNEKGRWEIAP